MESVNELYRNAPTLTEGLQAQLDVINHKIGLVNAATALLDGFGIVVVGHGIYKQLSGRDASGEREVGDVIARYRAEFGALRARYETERSEFLDSQRSRLGESA